MLVPAKDCLEWGLREASQHFGLFVMFSGGLEQFLWFRIASPKQEHCILNQMTNSFHMCRPIYIKSSLPTRSRCLFVLFCVFFNLPVLTSIY